MTERINLKTHLGIPIGLGAMAGGALPVAAGLNSALILPAVLSLPVIAIFTIAFSLLSPKSEDPYGSPLMRAVGGLWLGLIAGGLVVGPIIGVTRNARAGIEERKTNNADLHRCESWAAKGRNLQVVIVRFDGTTETIVEPERACFGGGSSEVSAFFTSAPSSGVLKLREEQRNCVRRYDEVNCELPFVREDGTEVAPYSRYGSTQTDSWKF